MSRQSYLKQPPTPHLFFPTAQTLKSCERPMSSLSVAIRLLSSHSLGLQTFDLSPDALINGVDHQTAGDTNEIRSYLPLQSNSSPPEPLDTSNEHLPLMKPTTEPPMSTSKTKLRHHGSVPGLAPIMTNRLWHALKELVRDQIFSRVGMMGGDGGGSGGGVYMLGKV